MNAALPIEKLLSKEFCQDIRVRAVPFGYSVSAPFRDNSGDRLSFFVKEEDDSVVLQDDGFYLSHLVASGIDVEKGQRLQLLDGVLAANNAYWDRETYEIRSHTAPRSDVGKQSVRFLSALMRVRDLELLSREMVRSTFKEDATNAILEHLGSEFIIEERAAVSPRYEEFPADVVVQRKTSTKRSGVFLVSGATQFLEAELLHGEIEKNGDSHSASSIALIEDADKFNAIGLRRMQRAINRGLPTPVFRGDEKASLQRIARLAA